mgnify:CR=1 FL=1
MKRTISILFLLTIFKSGIHGTTASPRLIGLTQPDGTTFSGNIRGNPRRSWYEKNGWSIVKDQNDWWVYADRVEGTTLIPSSEVVQRDESPETNPQLSHVTNRLIPDEIPFQDESPVPELSLARSDTFFVPCILVDFSDYSHSYSKEALEQVWNLEGYSHPGEDNTGSFRDFYQEISYGLFLLWVIGLHLHTHMTISLIATLMAILI